MELLIFVQKYHFFSIIKLIKKTKQYLLFLSYNLSEVQI